MCNSAYRLPKCDPKKKKYFTWPSSFLKAKATFIFLDYLDFLHGARWKTNTWLKWLASFGNNVDMCTWKCVPDSSEDYRRGASLYSWHVYELAHDFRSILAMTYRQSAQYVGHVEDLMTTHLWRDLDVGHTSSAKITQNILWRIC